jgi:CBS domain-containing protein
VRYADFLLEIGELRNAMIHNRTGEELYLAVPNEQTVLELERIEQLLLAPERVVPRFQRVVMTLAPDDTLADVWQRIRDHGYSRFPVYGPEGFLGLLTSNGIARWCAAALRNGRLEIDARSVPLSDVLDADHRREHVAFISRDALIDDVEALFTRREPLELVIITEHGRLHERPIGLISAADVAGFHE